MGDYASACVKCNEKNNLKLFKWTEIFFRIVLSSYTKKIGNGINT